MTADEVTEQMTIKAPPREVFAAVADLHRMARWSPECFAVWICRSLDGLPQRFVGWNRRRGYVWFTTCRVVVARPGEEFAFDVTTFGQPVSRWGYRFAPAEGGTVVTEYWQDRRNKASRILGRVFTGEVATRRPQVNREAMRTTLTRLKSDLE
jgi:hypothetical protein